MAGLSRSGSLSEKDLRPYASNFLVQSVGKMHSERVVLIDNLLERLEQGVC
jgi:hypothetical protein